MPKSQLGGILYIFPPGSAELKADGQKKAIFLVKNFNMSPFTIFAHAQFAHWLNFE